MISPRQINPQKRRRNLTKTALFFQRGMTLTEFLIVITIVAILLLLLLWFSRTQLSRGRDAERKADLERIKISFEDYYNDNGCYPPSEVLNDCNSDSFQPYLSIIPCDPITDEPYLYEPLEGNNCKGYRLFTGLEDYSDPVIEALGCNPETGCGFGAGYNYGVSVGAGVVAEDFDPTASPAPGSPTPGVSPSAAPPIWVYACDTAGVCNQYEAGSPYLESCPTTFEHYQCENACDDPANWCSV